MFRLPTILLFALAVAGSGWAKELMVEPKQLALSGLDRQHGVIVTLKEDDGRLVDVTRKAEYSSGNPDIVGARERGVFVGLRDGASSVSVRVEGTSVELPVTVADLDRVAAPSFREDVIPVLTKTGCNQGGCHGKLAGQNGFRLSLRGYAPDWDHDWITKEVNGRRVNYAFPEQSLLITKPTGAVVHEGGTRFREGSRAWQTLVDWVAARAPGPAAKEATVDSLEVFPRERIARPGDKQQLLVRAHYSDGRVRDVTWLAQFFSNDENTVTVKPDGMVRAVRHGETAVRVHFQGLVQVVRFTMPYENAIADANYARHSNAIDAPIFAKLKALRIPPSPDCDDATFIRRACLDTIGALPTVDETAGFLADRAPDKRARLVDQLLTRPEWVDYWTLQLADLLQNRRERDHDVRGVKGVRSFHAWLRGELQAGKSWAEIAKAVLLANGDSIQSPQVGYFVTVIGEKRNVEESELPDSAAQSFLGTRIGCARCHNHPLERYTQDDFYHFAAFFSKLSLDRQKPETGATAIALMSNDEMEANKRVTEAEKKLADLNAPEFAASGKVPCEELKKQIEDARRQVEESSKRVTEAHNRPATVNQPRTNQRMVPQTLDRISFANAPGDPREALVDWMLKNDLFSGAMVNRLWKHFFSKGLVEPVDDLRASNPPSNGELWKSLNAEFVSHNYDIRHVMKLILTSRAYALSSDTEKGNETETRFYSHYYARRLPAEVLMDAIASATGTPQKFSGYPVGLRAVQLPEPGVDSYFLSLFGRSERVTACACERAGEVTLPQLLHLHNGEEMQRQIDDAGGRLKAILAAEPPSKAVDALFACTVQRAPTDQERAAIEAALPQDEREPALRDLFWALLNSKEFAFNH